MNEQALRAVLAEQAEAPSLEYKQLRDLDRTEDVVKLARDVAAMQSQGGYIVIGVDGRGVPTDTLTPRHVQLFDEATVRDKLKKYIAAPLDLRVACHVIDGAQVALIYVPHRRTGFTVMAAPGEYVMNEKIQSRFACGDIFIRTGTGSEPLTQETFDQRMLSLLEGERSSTPALSLGLTDTPEVSGDEELALIWSMRMPRQYNPPQESGGNGLVIRAQVGLRSVEQEVLIDSPMRTDLIQSLPLSAIDRYVGELSYGMHEWLDARWAEAGFNTTWALTVERRPATTVVPPQFWARVSVVEPQVAHPNAPVDVLVDAVYVPGPHYSNISGTTRLVDFEKKVPLRNLYDLLHASMATALKVGRWLEGRAVARYAGTPYLAVYLETGSGALSDFIDFGQARQVDGSSFSMAAWEVTPPGIDTNDVEERDRFIKLWLKKTMIAGGLRDFEYQVDAFVPRQWPL